MAKIETRSIQVAPQYEQSTINEFEMFGWSVSNSQTIDTKDSHLEKDKDGNLVSVTEHESYVKLTFQRDRDMNYYKEIADCESRYYSLKKAEPALYVPGMLKILGILLVLVGLITIKSIGFLLLIGAGVCFYFFAKKKKEVTAAYDIAHKKWAVQFAQVKEEVRQYC